MSSSQSYSLESALKNALETEHYLFIPQKNEYPDDLRLWNDIQTFSKEATTQVLTIEALQNARDKQDAAILEESYGIMFGDWLVMKRKGSSLEPVPAPEFKRVVEEINMSGFTMSPQSSFYQTSQTESQETPRLSIVDTTDQSLDFANEASQDQTRLSVSEQSEVTAISIRSNSNRKSIDKDGKMNFRGSDVSEHTNYKKIIRDSRASFDRSRTQSMLVVGNTRKPRGSLFSTWKKQKKEGVAMDLSEFSSALNNTSNAFRKLSGAGKEIMYTKEGDARKSSADASNLGANPEEDGRRSSATEQVKSVGITDSELDRVKPFLLNSTISAEIELPEKDFARLLSIYEKRFVRSSCFGTPYQKNIAEREKSQLLFPYPDRRYTYMLFSALSLHFDHGPIEPLFCRAALYDARNQRKISEDFGFHVNKKEEMSFLSQEIQKKLKQASQNNIYDDPTGLFKILEPHPEIYLVVWVDRIHQTNMDDVIKAHKDGKSIEKLKKKCKESISNMSWVKQNFLWGSLKLFYPGDRIESEMAEGVKHITLYRYPSGVNTNNPFDIFTCLIAMSKSEDCEFMKDHYKIGITLKVNVNHASKDKMSDFSLQFNQIRINKQLNIITNIKSSEKFAFECHVENYFRVIEDFPIYIPTTPTLKFSNSLLLYPEGADLQSTTFRNIIIQISFKSDDKVDSNPEQRICDAFDHKDFLTHVLTNITYHQKQPQFLDEIRIELPIHPTPKSHIVFEVLNVKTHKKDPEEKKIIGYSFLKIFEQNAFLEDGVYTLPVYKKLVDDYMDSAVSSSMELVSKATISIRTKHNSSLFCQDKSASSFFQAANIGYPILNFFADPKVDSKSKQNPLFIDIAEKWFEGFENWMQQLKNANPMELLQHTPLIINILFKLLLRIQLLDPTKEQLEDAKNDDDLIFFLHRCNTHVPLASKACIESMLHFLSNVMLVTREQDRKNVLMNQYVQFFFKNIPSLREPLYRSLLKLLNSFLTKMRDNNLLEYNPQVEEFTLEHLMRKSWSRFNNQSDTSPIPSPKLNATISSADLLRFSWFFLDIMLKSIHLYILEVDKESPFKKETVLNDSSFIEQLNEYISLVIPLCRKCVNMRFKNPPLADAGRNANIELGHFLRDLIPVIGVDKVMGLLHNVFSFLDTSKTKEEEMYTVIVLSLEFIEVFSDFDNYIPYLLEKTDQMRFFVDKFCNTLVAGINFQSEELQLQCFRTIKLHLTMLDFDPRMQDEETRKKVINLYTPYIFSGGEVFAEVLKRVTKIDVLMEFLVTIMYILYNADEEVVSEWIKKQKHTVITSLYDVLLITVILMRKYHNPTARISFTYVCLRIYKKLIVENYIKVFASTMIEDIDKIEGEEGSVEFDNEKEGSGSDLAENTQSSSVSKKQSMVNLLDLFEKSSYFLLNLILTSPYHDTKTLHSFFNDDIYSFLSNYSKFFILSDRFADKDKIGHETHASASSILSETYTSTFSAWRSLFGGILLHATSPTIYTHDCVLKCIKSMVNIYKKEEIFDDTMSATGNTDETSEEDLTGTSLSSSISNSLPNVSSSLSNTATNNTSFSIGSELVEADEVEYDIKDKSVIVGATLRKLVELLFEQAAPSRQQFYVVFFTTYLSFSQPIEVLAEARKFLKKIFSSEDYANVRDQYIINYLQRFKYWIKEHFDDFNNEFIANLYIFLDCDLSSAIEKVRSGKSGAMLGPLMKMLIKKLLEVKQTKQISRSQPPQKIIPKKFTTAMLSGYVLVPFNLIEWDAVELARQCTLIDFSMFKALQTKELFVKDKTNTLLAPNICAMTARFNQMSQWAVTEILKQTDDAKRVAVVRKFLEMCDAMREMKNYSGINMLVAACNKTAVFRLKFWEQNPDLTEKRTKYETLMAHPYNELRKEIEQATPPCIPFLGMILTELEFTSQNSKFREAKKGLRKVTLINFKKCSIIVSIIARMKEKQQTHYDFEEIPYLSRVLTNDIFTDLYTEDECWTRSLELQPQQRG